MQMKLGRTVNAPIAEVFDVFADFNNVAERVDGIQRVELLTDGPIQAGTRFRETRIMFGRESTEEMEITEFKPNDKYVVEADSCGSHFQSTFRFLPAGNRTKVEVELNTRAESMFAKLIYPLGKLMAGTMKKCLLSDIDQLKEHCERAAV
jgi:carbon monoxide dehydrogenase subunit G